MMLTVRRAEGTDRAIEKTEAAGEAKPHHEGTRVYKAMPFLNVPGLARGLTRSFGACMRRLPERAQRHANAARYWACPRVRNMA